MAKPTLEDMLYADCKNERKMNYLLNYVGNIKWLKKNNLEVTLENLEALYLKLKEKYPVMIAYVMSSNINSWVCMLKTKDTHQHVNTLYAQSMFEVFLKAIIVIDAYVNLGDHQKDEQGRPDEA